MKKLIYAFAASAFLFVIFYACGVFMWATFDMSLWGGEGRACLGAFLLIAMIVFLPLAFIGADDI
jgi:hypothetical protein